MGFVGSRYGLALVTSVGEILIRVAAGNARSTGVGRGVVLVLEADGDVAVAALVAVGAVVAAARRGLADEYQREVGILGIVNPVVILVNHRSRDRVDPAAFGCLAAEHALAGRLVDLGNIDFEAAFLRQDAAVILQHHDGLELGLVACCHEIGVADGGRSLVRIAIRVLEETGAEAVHQQAHGRGLEALAGALLAVFFHPQVIGLQDGTLLIVASELVHSCFDDLEMTLAFGEGFVAPGLSFESVDAGVVLGDVPVRTYYAVKSVGIAEQVGYEVLAVAVAVLFSGGILVVGYGVVRHHGRGHLGLTGEFEGSFGEGADLGGEVVAGIDGVLAVGVMRVAAGFLRTSGRPVLDHGVDGFVAPAVLDLGAALRGLEAVHIGAGHVDVKLRILAESAVETAPARLGGQVDLRGERRGYAQGAILARGDAAELFDQLRVEGRRHAEAGRPLRDVTAVAGVELSRGLRPMARVGGVVGRHAVSETFDEGLDVVVPPRCIGRGGDACHQDGAEIILFEEFLLGIGDSRSVDGLMAAIEHHSGYLVNGKL